MIFVMELELHELQELGALICESARASKKELFAKTLKVRVKTEYMDEEFCQHCERRFSR